MGANTKITWADHTVNFWTGCEPVSEGCDNCYAARFLRRCGRDPSERRRVSDKTIQQTLRAAKPGDYIFVNSMSDFFDRGVPHEWVEEALDTMVLRPDLIFLLLTKRAKRMRDWCNSIEDKWSDGGVGCRHIWLGVTAENQARADERIPKLLSIDWPGKRFVSVEPMLGPITDICHLRADGFKGGCADMTHIDWIIVGGESGPNARPMHPDWARSLRDQCVAAGVAFHFKQWGEWCPAQECQEPSSTLDGVRYYEFFADGQSSYRVGKKRAGRMLDGKVWDERPT